VFYKNTTLNQTTIQPLCSRVWKERRREWKWKNWL